MRAVLFALVACLTVLASATVKAQCTGQACVRVGPRLVSVSTQQSALLDTTLSGLLGVSVDLTVADHQALTGTQIRLDRLIDRLTAASGLSVEATLSGTVSYATLLVAMSAAVRPDSAAAADALDRLATQSAAVSTRGISFGELFVGDLRPVMLAQSRVNTLDLLMGSASLFNARNVAVVRANALTGSQLGMGTNVSTVDIGLVVVEPARFVCGGVGTRFYSASLRLRVHLELSNLSVALSVLGLADINVALGSLDLVVAIASASGTITTIDAIAGTVALSATPSVAELYLGTVSDANFLDRTTPIDPATEVTHAQLGRLTLRLLLVSAGASISLRAVARGTLPTPVPLQFTGPYPQTLSASTQAGFATNLIVGLLENLDLRISLFDPPLLDLVGTLLSDLLSAVLNALAKTGGLLRPLLDGVVGNVLDPVLNLLGVKLGEATITVEGVHRPPTGTACDDGAYCTVSDACSAAGACIGSARACTDNRTCTTDSCDEVNDRCVNTLATGCLIDSTCIAEGALDPMNGCRACRPERSTTSYSDRVAGAACTDGVFCTVGDACDGSGHCLSAARDCSDGIACTADVCNEQLARCVSTIATGCYIGNACIPAGSDDPSNACRVCDPARDKTAYSNKTAGAVCADGLFCTTGDACNGLGVCTGAARSCDDGYGCTTDVCNEAGGRCVSSVTSGCKIGNACIMAGAIDPTNPCRVCDPMQSTSTYSLRPVGASCSDDRFCTVSDACDASGTCVGTARVCDPGMSGCSMVCDEAQDTCRTDVTGCLVNGACVASGTEDPSSPCRVCNPAQSSTAYSPRPVGTTCSDGQFCTIDDACTAGGVCSGQARPCGDTKDCTTDTCDESTDTCKSDVSDGCLIEGTCYAADDPQPDHPCNVCTPTANSRAWTPRAAGTSCTDGLFCTTGDACDGEGVCRGTPRNCGGNGCASVCDEQGDSCRTDLTSCAIDGVCWAAGSIDPTSPCRICDPQASISGWTSRAASVLCDDGAYCTVGDHCDGLGACHGTPRDCGGGNGLCADVCDEREDRCRNDRQGCSIGSVCHAPGDVDPSNPCQVCDPDASTSAWTRRAVGTVCSDGLFCTTGDACSAAGTCEGTALDCSDGKTCTSDQCDESADRCTSTITDGCLIGGVCQASGAARANGCQTCDPSVSRTSWSNEPAGRLCSDGLFCTIDACDGAGSCLSAARDCSDGIECTTDACDEQLDRCASAITSGCYIGNACVPAGSDDPSSACRVCDPARSRTAYSNKVAGTQCADGLFCTTGDACDGSGACVGSQRNCDDGLSCTSDACNEAVGRCISTLASGCKIGNACVMAGAIDPTSPCRACDPTQSTSTYSLRAIGASCSDERFCTVDDACDAVGACVGRARVCDPGQSGCAVVCDEAQDSCRTSVTGCLVNGACVAAGTEDPTGSCRVCDPGQSTTAYSPRTVGTACSDGLFCTIGDACNASGVCTGTARPCGDTNDCTTDTCDESMDTCRSQLSDGCLIDDTCYAADDEEPGNPCHVCDPDLNMRDWTALAAGTACDDERFCTTGDACDGEGSCRGVARDCGGIGCANVCDEQGDRCRSDLTSCSIDGVCWAAGSIDPASPCRLCDPQTSNTDWTDLPTSTSCDDGAYCTVSDHCDGLGTCRGTPRTCAGSGACAEVCDEREDRCRSDRQGCSIAGVCHPRGDVDPDNPCQVCDPDASTSAWSSRPVGTVCSDGLFCTTGDACNTSGRCEGTLLDCDDGKTCTRDLCDETARSCTNAITTGCLIGGTCQASGASNANGCQTCDPGSSTTSWTDQPAGSFCTDGLFCTVEACDGAGSCVGAPLDCSDGADCTTDACDEGLARCVSVIATGCYIGNACVPAGSDAPGNACLTCDPSRDRTAYSNKASGTPCADGLFCTTGDACDGRGACGGSARSCDDMLDCTDDLCDEAAGRCVSTLARGCKIGNACVAADTLDPANPCRVCDAMQSTTSYSLRPVGASCSDERFCTIDDACDAAGTCMGQARVCDPGSSGCSVVCDESNDSCRTDVTGCLVNGACVAAGTEDPTSPCRVCDPVQSTTRYSARAEGTLCSDGLFCTIDDACDATGTCNGRARACADTNDCTDDVCDESADTCRSDVGDGCLIDGTCYAADDEQPDHPCNVCDPTVNSRAFTPRAAGESCSDDRFCTVDDACDGAGVCRGTPRDCGGVGCASVCDEGTDSCRSDLTSCSIGGVCWAAGAEDPDSSCRVCDPDVSTTGWTDRPATASCDDGAFCTVDDHCAQGTCRGMPRQCGGGAGACAEVCDEQENRCRDDRQGCAIAGVCHAPGDVDPDNPCQVCDPDGSTSAWTVRPVGSVCSDGLFCTTGDVCSAAGRCEGTSLDCSDGKTCTRDECDEAADRCTSTVTAGCLIDGVCHDAGEDAPAGCQTCNPGVSATSWSNEPAGAVCSDGLFCTDGDACDGAGRCTARPRDCSDGLACTDESCDESLARCVSVLVAGCAIDGACIAAGSDDPDNACRSCDPSLSTSSYSNKSIGARCADGLFCTAGDACDGRGACVGIALGCDDGLPCTDDVCDEAGARCVSSARGSCVVEGACVAAGTLDPTSPCRVCDPAQSVTSYSLRPVGVSCADDRFCTVDETCDASGACIGRGRVCDPGATGCTAACDESQARCRTDVTGCFVDGACMAAGTDDPASPCRVCDPVRSTTDYSPRTVGSPCSDGLFCTTDDACDASGVCSGRARSCGDDNDCTADTCDENTDTCKSDVSGGCLIDGVCHAAGDEDPDNACRVCDPSANSRAFTPRAAGTACSDDRFCTVDDACDGEGGCSGQPRSCGRDDACATVCDESSDSCRSDVASCTIDGVCWAAGSDDPENPCRTCAPALSTTGWSAKPAGSICDDDAYCTVDDRCDGSGRCTGSARSCAAGDACDSVCDEREDRCREGYQGCAILGACHAPGDVDPENPCRVCDPSATTTAWSQRPVGSTCSDGLFCTTGDVCGTSGLCEGVPLDCSDEQTCTRDVCDETAGRCLNTVSDGCLIDGVCTAAGADSPDSVCKSCNPMVSTTSWSNKSSGVSCSDGLFCTVDDRCDGEGTCMGAFRSCSSGASCDSFCDEASDACRSDLLGCTIGSACIAAGTDDPENGCLTCAPERSLTEWSPKLRGTSCSDGLFCTEGDACDGAGRCAGSPRSCEDDLTCTRGSCDESADRCTQQVTQGCLIGGSCVAAGVSVSESACRVCDPTRSTFEWSNASTSVQCDDGFFCTRDDRCDGEGRCVGRASPCLDDGLSCTRERCDEAGARCLSDLTGCLVGGVCRRTGEAAPDDACQLCLPSRSQSTFSYDDAAQGCDSDRDGLRDQSERPEGDVDHDRDGRPDHLDPDDDDDGLPTRDEEADRDGDGSPQDARDRDGDGTPDYLDPDDDGDGRSTADERADAESYDDDVDGDGILNWHDTDSDGDGASDAAENAGDGDANDDDVPDYLDPARAPVDSDQDELPDLIECPDGPGTCPDSDGDGLTDPFDADDDQDGVQTRFELRAGARFDSDDDGIPNHLDLDDDGDTLLTRIEGSDPNGDGNPIDALDTDRDGLPDYLDPDDDNDTIPTAQEVADAMRFGSDPDGDAIPNWHDFDSDNDSISDWAEQTVGPDMNDNLIPDYVEFAPMTPADAGMEEPEDAGEPPTRIDGGIDVPSEDAEVELPDDAALDAGAGAEEDAAVSGGLAGGSFCGVRTRGETSRSELIWLLLMGACLAWRRRRMSKHVARASLLALLLTGASARADVTLDRYFPSPRTDDGVAVSRPITSGHLRLDTQLQLDFARDPLVWERRLGDSDSVQLKVVSRQMVAHAIAALTLYDRALAFVQVPGILIMSGDPSSGVRPDGAGLGNVRIGARVRLLGDETAPFALAAQGTLGLPTSRVDPRARLSGEDKPTGHAQVLAEGRLARARITGNVGARFRDAELLSTLHLSQELTFGLGAGYRVHEADLAIDVLAELFGATSFTDFGQRERSPLEASAGAKLTYREQLVLGGMTAFGLTHGYGAPAYRVVGMVGYAITMGRRARPPVAAEPTEPTEIAPPPPVNDTDGDGIADEVDACPALPESFNGYEDQDGCPDRVRIAHDRIELTEPVLFDGRTSEILSISYPMLREVVALLREHPEIERVRIEGHTDLIGDEASNQTLSEARAESVRAFLIAYGIAPERLVAIGYGESRPLLPNATGFGRFTNRRVELWIER